MINDTGITEADAIALAMIMKAKAGDVAAAKEAMDSAFGKITDKQELTGAEGKPLIPVERFTESGEAMVAYTRFIKGVIL